MKVRAEPFSMIFMCVHLTLLCEFWHFKSGFKLFGLVRGTLGVRVSDKYPRLIPACMSRLHPLKWLQKLPRSLLSFPNLLLSKTDLMLHLGFKTLVPYTHKKNPTSFFLHHSTAQHLGGPGLGRTLSWQVMSWQAAMGWRAMTWQAMTWRVSR